MSEDVAYVECLAAQEAAYWDARARGYGLTDKQVGDVLRAAAPHLRTQCEVERAHGGDEYSAIVATLAIYGEDADIPSLVAKARALNQASPAG